MIDLFLPFKMFNETQIRMVVACKFSFNKGLSHCSKETFKFHALELTSNSICSCCLYFPTPAHLDIFIGFGLEGAFLYTFIL